jgi:ATP-binding cassette, subfamily B, bacterial
MSEEKEAPVRVRELYRAVWRHAAGVRARFLLAMAMLTTAQSMKLALPWLAAQAIDTIQSGGSLAAAGRWIAAIVATMAGVWALHGPGRVIERGVALRVRRSLADALYGRLAQAPLAWHERQHSGALQHRLQQACGALNEFTQTQFIYLQNLVNLLGPLVALALLSWLTGAIALAGYAAIGTAIVAFDGRLMKLAEQENAAERRYTARLLDFVGNVGSLLALKLQPAARRLLDERVADTQVPRRRSIVVIEWKWCAVDLLTVALTWGLVAAYAWQAHASAAATVMLGSLFMVYQYAQQAAGVVSAMASHYQSFARVKINYASAQPLWQAPQNTAPAANAAPAWRRLAVEHLTYRHAKEGEEDRGGVRDINLELRRGERIALVGGSGSGKSTLLRVLAGLYEAQGGSVRSADGARFDRTALAAQATLIPQEAEIFETTLRENLSFGEPVHEAALVQALHASAFDRVLRDLPEGLDHAAGERGANFSGGQRQRLALARGVLAARGCALLLLDEPTSALDPVTERLVHERLHDAFAGASIVASVHRMELLQHYDRVAFMRDGRLVDVGRAHDVAARQPAFAQMLQGGGVPLHAAPALAAA